ncbi:MAG: hypothetical protein JXL20_04680 [Deltaproteobacteria bacterium]|nr:hypothetical protein [Deltaproteobacteria bacterium]
MTKRRKIAILGLTAAIAVGGGAAYLFMIGPFGKPVLATVNGEKILVAGFQKETEKVHMKSFTESMRPTRIIPRIWGLSDFSLSRTHFPP